ncbi:MAG: GGDEF domain-containing protein [Gammaproteobacteria bacterium]|nr:GGDEF domain-containing protein [Gammaproteobacteria bacterium]
MAQPNLSVIHGKKTDYNTVPEKSSSTIIKRVEKQKFFQLDKTTLTELTNRLHSYIEINMLIGAFSDEVKPILELDDLSYKLPGDETPIKNKGRHYISYNLSFNKENLGELFFIRRYRFVEKEAEIIEKLIIALLSPIYNAYKFYEVSQLAQTDPLTGTLNRMGLEKSFSREIDLAHRNKTDLSVLLFDIDHFKLINDYYGHHTGDLVLQEMTKQINQCIRTTDVFARFGGEEFIVLLNNTSRSGALLLAERIRQQIESTHLNIDNNKIQYTTSIGVTSIQDRDDKESIFKRADSALYQAKNNGRNRVVLN